MTRNLNGMREIVRRELEKERIRQQIIAEEIARRRELEAATERQLALQRTAASGAEAVDPSGIWLHRYPTCKANGFDPPPPPPPPLSYPACGDAGMIHPLQPPSDFEASSEKVISWPGIRSEVVLGSHLNGKKHAARVKRVDTQKPRDRHHCVSQKARYRHHWKRIR